MFAFPFRYWPLQDSSIEFQENPHSQNITRLIQDQLFLFLFFIVLFFFFSFLYVLIFYLHFFLIRAQSQEEHQESFPITKDA